MLIMAAETAVHSGTGFLDVIRCFVAGISMIIGMFFILAGSIGVLRLPDFFSRIHAGGVIDTLGVELILFGLIVQSGFTQLSLKLVMVGLFLFLTSPTATHAIAHAAYVGGMKPRLGPYKAPTPDDIRGNGAKEGA